MGRARLDQHRLPAGRRRARSRSSAARAICSTPTIAGIEQADALLIIGANPRREAAVLNARIRKRWRSGDLPIGRDRREGRPHLSTTTISAPGPRRWPSSSTARHFAEARTAKHPLVIDRAGRARAAGRRRDPRAGGQGRARGRRDQGRLERLLRSCTPPPRASAGSTSASCRAQGGLTPPADGAGRRARRAVPARRRRDRHRAGRLRRLHRHAWRPRRASRRRDPAGRGLHGKVRHSTSTPRAACRWPTRAGFPPGDAREDWAILRALSDRARPASCPTTRWRSCARRCSRRIRISRARSDRAGRCGRHREAWRRSAARPTRRRSARRSPTSI